MIFDIQVLTDTDAPPVVSRSILENDPRQQPLREGKEEKASTTPCLCLACRRHFTPLIVVFSVDYLRGAEVEAACKKLASCLAHKW